MPHPRTPVRPLAPLPALLLAWLPAVAHAGAGPGPAASAAAVAAPADALAAAAHLGLPVLDVRRAYDTRGNPVSRTVLGGTLDALYARVSELFSKGAPFAEGWTVEGAGRSEAHGFVTATIQDPDGLRWTATGRARSDGKSVEVEVVGRPYAGLGARMAPVAPDRKTRRSEPAVERSAAPAEAPRPGTP